MCVCVFASIKEKNKEIAFCVSALKEEKDGKRKKPVALLLHTHTYFFPCRVRGKSRQNRIEPYILSTVHREVTQ